MRRRLSRKNILHLDYLLVGRAWNPDLPRDYLARTKRLGEYVIQLVKKGQLKLIYSNQKYGLFENDNK